MSIFLNKFEVLSFSICRRTNFLKFVGIPYSGAKRIDERESAVKVLLRCSKGDREEERCVRHEGRGVPMSRMENDPPLHSGVSRSSRFPSTRRSHFPAYSAMIQFGCAFYARYGSGGDDDREASSMGGYRAVLRNPAMGNEKGG